MNLAGFMMKTLKYICNALLLIAIPFSAQAQKGTVMPSALRVGTDLGYIGVSLFDPEKRFFEFSADLDVYKFFLTADYGTASWSFNQEDYEYDNKGSYFKAGVDYNLLARDPDLNVIYFGVKYAMSHFNESLNYSITDPWYYDYSKLVKNSDMGASWIEANFGMKVRVWQQLYFGWAGRIKFARKIQADGSEWNTYYIPGYGYAESESRWGFNYQISYRIPFRDKPPYKPKKIKEEKVAEDASSGQ